MAFVVIDSIVSSHKHSNSTVFLRKMHIPISGNSLLLMEGGDCLQKNLDYKLWTTVMKCDIFISKQVSTKLFIVGDTGHAVFLDLQFVIRIFYSKRKLNSSSNSFVWLALHVYCAIPVEITLLPYSKFWMAWALKFIYYREKEMKSPMEECDCSYFLQGWHPLPHTSYHLLNWYPFGNKRHPLWKT